MTTQDGRKNNSGTKGNSGGTKSLNDRRLSAEVRSLTLNKIKKLLEQPASERTDAEYTLFSAVLLKLSGNILPKLQYHSDGEGEALFPAPLSEEQLAELLSRRKEAQVISGVEDEEAIDVAEEGENIEE